MIAYFRTLFQFKTTWVLLVISLFSIFLSVVRVLFTERSMFLFMFWNLFLAFLPWFIATILHLNNVRNKLALALLILCWLALFPNAPYVLTDIIHLGKKHSAPVWFDLILLLSYGFAGLLYGFVSLQMMEARLNAGRLKRRAWLLSIFMIYLSCCGIYLGRFLRWNSWDLVTNLDEVLADVFSRIANPFAYATTWVFTFLFGTLLNILFWSYKSFNAPVALPATPSSPPIP